MNIPLFRKLLTIMVGIGLVGTFAAFWFYLFLGISTHDCFHLTLANSNLLAFILLFYLEDHIYK
jgi:hypothetical protein